MTDRKPYLPSGGPSGEPNSGLAHAAAQADRLSQRRSAAWQAFLALRGLGASAALAPEEGAPHGPAREPS